MINAIYVRQSVEKENSISLETQVEYAKCMIKPDEREYEIKIYRDEGASGGNTNREGFQKLMQDVQKGIIKKVIVYRLDRISRSLNDFVGILQTFKDNGVEFVSSQESFDTSTIYGELILKILVIFAEFERMSIIERVKDAYAKRTDLGLYMGGRKQYGYTLQEKVIQGIKTKTYVPQLQEMNQVSYIFEMYAQEQVSLRMVVDNLVAHNMLPIEGAGWTTAKISNILKNAIYVKADGDIYNYFASRGVKIINDLKEFDGTRGAKLYGKTTHDSNLSDWSDMKLVLMDHEGNISSDIWLKCQNKLVKNKQVGNSVSNNTSWLAGMLMCAKCGHTMTTTKSLRVDGAVRRYFQCTGRSHKKTCSGIKTTVYAEEMESLVSKSIAQKLEEIGEVRSAKGSGFSDERNRLKIQQQEIEQEQQKLTEIILNQGIEVELLKLLNEKAKLLSHQKQQIFERLIELQRKEESMSTVVQLAKHWKEASYKEKKAVANVLIQKVVLYEDGSAEIIWDF